MALKSKGRSGQERPLHKTMFQSKQKHYAISTAVDQHGAYDNFRTFVLGNGGVDCQVIADGCKHRIGTADKPKSKDFVYCLFSDLRGGWILNFRNGNGVVKWRYKSGERWNPTPAERAAIAESQRRWRVKQNLESWVRCEARRVGLLIFKFNQIVVRAVELLKTAPHGRRAEFALSVAYRWLTRLEYQHDLLLSKDPADWLDVFRHSRASGKTERRAA